MKKIKILSAVLAVVLLLGLVGCAAPQKNATDRELYDIGKELIKIQLEMVKSDKYQTMIGASSIAGNSLRDTVIAGNYDSPSAVYSIKLSDIDALMDLFTSDWKELSETLREQLRFKVSIINVISQVNAKRGTDAMVLSSLNNSHKEFDGITVDQDKVFLYVFENGTPIAVRYGKSGATAYFVFLDKTDSIEDIQAEFSPYKCSVEKLNIK